MAGTVLWYRSPRKCQSVLLTLQLQSVLEYSTRRAGLLAYEHGKSAQYIITPTHAHSQHPPCHPLAHTFVCDDRFITAIQLLVLLVLPSLYPA